jgi:hypothetical protein
MNDIRAEHINAALSSYEAARTGFFTLYLPNDLNDFAKPVYDTTNGPPTTNDGKLIDYGTGKSEEAVRLNVLTADVPHFSLEVLQYKRGNEVVKFAGVPTFEAGTVKVDDVVGLHTKDILMGWQERAYDVHTGKGGRMTDYKRECTLVEYTQDFKLIRKWTLVGCWISALSEDAFDKENDGKRAITATIQYDRAVMNEAD